MLTGINFSPPLYFLFNFCLQLFFPTSIEQLRIQSLIFIIGGIILSFLLTRKIFGSVAGFTATILVLSQSYLLLSQAQEARHYAMFFACGAWVLYVQSLSVSATAKNKWLLFLSHLSLCQVHYLGIIFSFLSGVSYFLTSKNRFWKRIPISITLCWLVSIFAHLFYLSKQQSVLNTWPKPNQLSDLLAGYNDSLLILSIIIPVFVFIIINKTDKCTKDRSIEDIQHSRPIIITTILWLTVPFIFWIISNLTSLNLFVDRYFIPKESALIFLIAYGFKLIFQKLPKYESISISILGTFALSLVLILISTKRAAFGLNKDTNYHHSLIIRDKNLDNSKAITLTGDPLYFPNAYLRSSNFELHIDEINLRELYKRFSTKIKFNNE